MKFDVVGRINNMRLPDGKTAVLYSVYEAVSNSIHAINDRFGEDQASNLGRIDIEIETNTEGDVESMHITDNGIGFTPENVSSFETSDSRFKYKRGGKGVGRFIWIKLFKDIKVQSIYSAGGQKQNLSFRFAPEETDSIQDKILLPASDEDCGTRVSLSKLRPEQKGRVRPTSYLKDLALHFFPQFIAKTLPKIVINVNGSTSSLNDFIAEKVETPLRTWLDVEFGEGEEKIFIDHLFVDPSISAGLRNSYLLTAHGRLVGDPVSIERKYALKELDNGKAYVCVISGDFLDERVDQERLGFQLTSEQNDTLENAVLKETEQFLSGHIKKLRRRQKIKVETLLIEHPQLATQIASMEEYVEGISPNMDEEQIAQNLFVLLYREEKELRKRIDEFDNLANLAPETRVQAEAMLEDISNQEKHRLAELVVKRHQVLQIANLLLKYDDAQKEDYHYERVIHELVCPMGEMHRLGEFANHNMWLVDETLSSYEFFASDKSIKSITAEGVSQKEPDILFFNPLGFRREGTTDPVVIVEFKRPGDERLSSDPINQVLKYIDELRDKTVRDTEGAVVTSITDNTPFECIIVCDLTASARKLFERSLAQNPTPDGEGYYGWSAPHKARIRVISYSKMLRDSELRHAPFFQQLKLDSPSSAAKKRSAKVREKQRAAVNENIQVAQMAMLDDD